MKLLFDKTLLGGIYEDLPHQPASFLQDAGSASSYMKILAHSLRAVFTADEPKAWDSTTSGEGPPLDWLSKQELLAIKECRSLLENASDDLVHWLDFHPEYGSVILCVKTSIVGELSISVLGLDKYEYGLKWNQVSDYDHYGKPMAYKMIHVGNILHSEFESVVDRFRSAFSKAQQRGGCHRSAAGNDQGHQKTPSLIHALLKQALLNDGQTQKPKGGFTDSGQHTGGKPRNTSFLCVASLFSFRLVQSIQAHPDLYERIMTFFDLAAAKDFIGGCCLVSEKPDLNRLRVDLDKAQEMISSAARKFEKLSDPRAPGFKLEDEPLDREFTLEGLLGFAEKLHRIIEDTFEQIQDLESARYSLEGIDKHLQEDSFRNPRLTKIAKRKDCKVESLDQRRERAKVNIQLLPIYDWNVGLDYRALRQWTYSSILSPQSRLEDAWLVVRTVEEFFFRLVEQGLSSLSLNDDQIEEILEVLDRYRATVHGILTKLDPLHHRKTELHSRELLVVWVAYCALFSSTQKKYAAFVRGLGVCLRYQDLEHLVLSSKRLMGVLHHVKCFLKDYYRPDNELFSLRCPGSTFTAAVTFTDEHLLDIFQEDVADADQRQKAYWAEVLKKKELLVRLRRELSSLIAEQSRVQRAVATARENYNSASTWFRSAERQTLNQLQAELNSINAQVSQKKSEIKRANIPPPPVEQPLPRNESLAKQWIFFLYMTDSLRSLARISFSAQQMLMPKRAALTTRNDQIGFHGPTVMQHLLIQGVSDSVRDFYNSRKSSTRYCSPNTYRGSEGDVLLRALRSFQSCKPSFPSTVDSIGSMSEGVWYPDSARHRMSWLGGPNGWDQVGGEFDPFLVQRDISVFCFTEQLGKGSQSLQWALTMDGTKSLKRGNQPLATQHLRPGWLSKAQYLNFGKIRGYPFLQLQSILTTLHDNQLPLERKEVYKLLCQAMFHVGALTGSPKENSSFLWKDQLYDEGSSGFMGTAIPVFQHIAVVLCETPSSYQSTELISTLGNFLSEFKEEIKSVSCRPIGKALQGWANAAEKESQALSGIQKDKARLKQSVLLRLAIFCFAGGVVTDEDIEEIVCLLTRCQNLCLNDQSNASEITALESTCAELVSAKIFQIRNCVIRKPQILNKAVNETLNEQLDHTNQWKSLPETCNPCFETTAGGCIFTVNVLNGVILVDGSPPGSLPAEILQHRVFQRAFGNKNFEVKRKNGIFETTNTIVDKIYKFYLSGSHLIVLESDKNTDVELELLDEGEGPNLFGPELPVRLREMHSAWLCRTQSFLLFRGIKFDDRSITFMATIAKEGLQNRVGALHQIPLHLRDKPIGDLLNKLGDFGRLVVPFKVDNSILSVVSKFEEVQFLHTVQLSNGNLQLELPRFDIVFEHVNGQLCCKKPPGFVLCVTQLYKGMFQGFHQYLVLESKDETRIVVPVGEVSRRDGATSLSVEKACNASCRWHSFKMNSRLGTLEAKTTEARFQLACLHASTTVRVVDSCFGLTGAERAMQLVRQNFRTSPFNRDEMNAVENLMALTKGRLPTIFLASVDVLRCSEQVHFLYRDMNCKEFTPTIFGDALNSDDCISAMQVQNPRMALSKEEHVRILGSIDSTYPGFKFPFSRCCPILKCPVSTVQIEKVERIIEKCLIHNYVANNTETEDFPLVHCNSEHKLEDDVWDDLRHSWSHHLYTSAKTYALDKDWCHRVRDARSKAKDLFLALSTYLAVEFASARNEVWQKKAKFLRLVNILPAKATMQDMIESVYKPFWLRAFNPFLLNAAQTDLIKSVVLFLRVAVLQDKIKRLESLQHNSAEIIRELTIQRVWNPAEYPCWVAFEAENGLQIRPKQAVVAKHLIENPSHVVQLNMGEGKTRVILPLLIIHWIFHRSDGMLEITRLNVLSSLFAETRDFFLRTFCAGVANLRLFQLPCCRDVVIDEPRARAMLRLIDQCKQYGGFFIVAPEHRLSLELKVIELNRSGHTDASQRLELIAHKTNWRDVLDESDELLHHRYRLIYATGSVEELPGGTHRYTAAQTLLSRVQGCPTLKAFFKRNPSLFIRGSNENTGAFPTFRINEKLMTGEMETKFREVLVGSVISQPPHHLDWLQDHPMSHEIKCFMVDPGASPCHSLTIEHQQDVLAFRGLLCSGVLFSCLRKRHRVDYGVARPGQKRIAIPFRAADTPSFRSEFAQPDCTIVLSCLSYYCDGLDDKQLHQAFAKLLSLGSDSRRKQYHSWFSLSKPSMDRNNFESQKIDVADKLDLSNSVQFASLKLYFARNMYTINFWLNSCVFPDEMQHFPQRMTATSWNLAQNRNGQVVGFSGTNDNHRLLPLMVKQFLVGPGTTFACPNEENVFREIMGTNGLMLHRILNDTLVCATLSEGDPVNTLLDYLRNSKTPIHALIDCGALLAGGKKSEIAPLILNTIQSREDCDMQGVCFSDGEKWMIREKSGRTLPKEESPVEERDSFSFYDEANCRGVDLKLKSDAVALLTLGPRMTKDKLMQAAGRMRKLGRDQKLIIVGTSEVMNQVRAASNKENKSPFPWRAEEPIVAKDVLEWVMKNTVDVNADGLIPWAVQGFFHATSYQNAVLVVEDERASLEDMYAESFETTQAAGAGEAARKYYLARSHNETESASQQKEYLVSTLSKRIQEYGTFQVRVARGTEEECERELELERELEQEEEKEVPLLDARSETEWNVDSIYSSTSPADLPLNADIKKLDVWNAELLSPPSIELKWCKTLYATRNFFVSVMSHDGGKLDQYLRIVDSVLFFPATNSALLLSEREADIIAEKIQLLPTDSVPFQLTPGSLMKTVGVALLRLTFARSAADGNVAGLNRDALSLACTTRKVRCGLNQVLSDDLLASLQLFAGETRFHSLARRAELTSIIEGNEDTIPEKWRNNETVQELVEMRGLSHCYPYSDLENVCRAVSRGVEHRMLSSQSTSSD